MPLNSHCCGAMRLLFAANKTKQKNNETKSEVHEIARAPERVNERNGKCE